MTLERIEIVDEKFLWCGFEWLTRERWGSIHMDKAWYWYDPTAIMIDQYGNLHLQINLNKQAFNKEGCKLIWEPKYDSYPNGKFVDDVIVSYYGAGTMSSVKEMGFGTYTLSAMFPTGNWLWPAFWLYPPTTWPPEIDIFEGYSKDTDYKKMKWSLCGFRKKLKAWNIQSCIHVKSGIPTVPAKMPDLDNFNHPPQNIFNTYQLFWGRTVLIFSINYKEVRRITDQKVLDHLAQYSPFMVLIQNQIDGFGKDKFNHKDTTPFVLQNFTFKPL